MSLNHVTSQLLRANSYGKKKTPVDAKLSPETIEFLGKRISLYHMVAAIRNPNTILSQIATQEFILKNFPAVTGQIARENKHHQFFFKTIANYSRYLSVASSISKRNDLFVKELFTSFVRNRNIKVGKITASRLLLATTPQFKNKVAFIVKEFEKIKANRKS